MRIFQTTKGRGYRESISKGSVHGYEYLSTRLQRGERCNGMKLERLAEDRVWKNTDESQRIISLSYGNGEPLKISCQGRDKIRSTF